MSKWKVDRKKMKRKDKTIEGKTVLFMIVLTVLSIILYSVSAYLVPLGCLAFLLFWLYSAEKDRYYTWGRYIIIIVVGTLPVLLLYVSGGGK